MVIGPLMAIFGKVGGLLGPAAPLIKILIALGLGWFTGGLILVVPIIGPGLVWLFSFVSGFIGLSGGALFQWFVAIGVTVGAWKFLP